MKETYIKRLAQNLKESIILELLKYMEMIELGFEPIKFGAVVKEVRNNCNYQSCFDLKNKLIGF